MQTTETIRPRTLDPMRARQIDFTLARVRHAVVKGELEACSPQEVAATYDTKCQGAVTELLSAEGGQQLKAEYGQVGLAINALWHAVQGRNRPAAEAAAVLVAAAAVALAAGGVGGAPSVGGGRVS